MTEKEEQFSTKTAIEAFKPFQVQVANLKSENEKLVFDYASKKGNKEARSHIYKLRQSKSEVERVRKEKKADSLAFGKKVDEEANSIKEVIGF